LILYTRVLYFHCLGGKPGRSRTFAIHCLFCVKEGRRAKYSQDKEKFSDVWVLDESLQKTRRQQFSRNNSSIFILLLLRQKLAPSGFENPHPLTPLNMTFLCIGGDAST
jgi:hypothetical protein